MAGDCCQVLGLNQGDLTAAGRAGVTIADNPSLNIEVGSLDRQHGLSTAGTDAKPDNLSRSHLCVQKLRERG
ncbi:hypothetical protein BOSEA31B_20420 [Hyphomicrobiales bacterium]|nr:hypothetical protein BOSEA31B_20420 [Hyphomicrobiales bacterium]CAH1702204.1 hypothetical protein BOSEA1005_30077 [Hyphomicrobiales bacterium]CAI0346407.1 hypothetical protein BO1005MUT1_510048 [Hyphomicrobiales bacterium]